jgi:DNA-binding transcriptional MerR regulator
MVELRMRELRARTGLSRQTIHFYVTQGLVDGPRKTGRTTGYYTEAHVERLALVRKLQKEHFLPLRAIRMVLANPAEWTALATFSPKQREMLALIKERVSPRASDVDAERLIDLRGVLARTGVTRPDFAALARLGLVRVVVRSGRRRISAEDAWLVELWSRVRAAGFVRELGFAPDLLALFDDGVSRIFEEEKRILARLTIQLSAPRVAELVERALPLVHAFLVRAHERKVRELFASAKGSR